MEEKSIKEIKASMTKYHRKASAVMDALRIAQNEGNTITREDMEEIAELLEMEPISVNEIAAFYTMYNLGEPLGKYHIQVCRNISCSLLKGEDIIAHLETTLGIKVGETTDDKLYTLSTVECLGSCGTAPMMQINDDYHEDLTDGKVTDILKGLK